MSRLNSLIKIMAIGGKTKLRVFIICLAISSVLWLFQSMGRQYTTDIILPVEYENLPDNKTFSTPPVNSLLLKVTGYGWDLWAYKLKFNKPSYRIDCEKLSSNEHISLNNARNLIVESVPGLTNILSLEPESINIALDDALRKKVPIVSDLQIIPSPGFGFSIAYPEPDSVQIFGPKALIESIKEIKTESKEIANAQGELQIETKIVIPEGVKINTSSNVLVKALLEPLTEKEIEVRIKVNGYKGNKKVNIYPRVATLKLQTTLSLFEKIENSDFEVYVDFDKINEKEGDELLEVKVKSKSSLVKNIRIHPKYVDYFFEEK